MRISSCEAMVRPLAGKPISMLTIRLPSEGFQNTGSTLKNFLSAAAYPQQTTFAGTLCAERIRCDGARKLAQQVILEGDALSYVS